ncbi:(2Fe-2S)-binding protein [Halomonas sp. WWR20]
MMDHSEHASPVSRAEASSSMAEKTRVSFTLNGEPCELYVEPNVVLLDALREVLDLTGTKKGCDHGQCGACTVLINGHSANSCLTLAVMQEGSEITTVEGLARGEQLHPVQEAFIEHDAYQCGYCTAGQMMATVSMLDDTRIGSDDASVKEAMSGNICRCGAYKNILSAIQSARQKV